ncbi:hypothetical protein NQ318_002766 [Aromia moschata]|uniref:Uncharacterized protein n=1 Tax=Aromia moschata TaxID=1265417 RepID=A0AAV8XHM1_9CUCU|nr:hypothetical protein NQ318_002766 [Aromia moschata]
MGYGDPKAKFLYCLTNCTPINQATVSQLVKKFQLRPFKLQIVHELNEDDFARRAEFCESMMERCNNIK